MKTSSPTELKSVAQGRWKEILLALAPQLEVAVTHTGKHVPCPVHGGKDGFRLFKDVNQTGGGISNKDGGFHDGISLLMWVNNWSFQETVKAIANYLSGVSSPFIRQENDFFQRAKNALDYDPNKLNRIKKTWAESVPLTNLEADSLQQYLLRRGIELKHIPNSIRFHPCLPYYENGKLIGYYRAMLAMVSTPSGEIANVHRTFITPDGQKAPVSSPKRYMGTPYQGWGYGGAIRLSEAGPILAIAEGIETALSIYAATGIPTWAAGDAGKMERIEVPAIVREVIICADHDPESKGRRGQRAANVLALRLIEKGLKVRIAVPPTEGEDWNDVLLREQTHV